MKNLLMTLCAGVCGLAAATSPVKTTLAPQVQPLKPGAALTGYNVGPLQVQAGAGLKTFGLVATRDGQVRLARPGEKAAVTAQVNVGGAATVHLCGYLQTVRQGAKAKLVRASLVGRPYFCSPGALPPTLR